MASDSFCLPDETNCFGGPGFFLLPVRSTRLLIAMRELMLPATGFAHKHQRAIAYSAFSERRIKSMLPVMYDVVKKVRLSPL